MASKQRGRNALFSILLLFMAMMMTFGIGLYVLTPKNYALDVGDIAQVTIYATRDVVDESATSTLRDRARNNAQTVYVIDEARVATFNTGAKEFFDMLDAIRSEASALLLADESMQGATLTASGWFNYLSDRQKTDYMARSTPKLTESQLGAVLSASENEMLQLRNVVLPKLSTILSTGLAAENVERMRSSAQQEIEAVSGLATALKSVGSAAIKVYLDSTYVIDETATAIAKEAAAAAVDDVIVKKGEAIVMEGATVSVSQLAMLEALDLVRPQNADVRMHVGLLLCLACSFVLFVLYLIFYHKDVLFNFKRSALICILIGITMLFRLIAGSVSPHISLAVMAVMLTALMVGEGAGIVLSVLMGVCLGFMAGGKGLAVLQFESISVCISTVATGLATVFSLRKTQNRNTLIVASVVGGAVGALSILGMCLMAEQSVGATLTNMGWCLGSAALSGLLVVGSMPIWEKMFDVATSTGLNELLNANHPLLKQLMADAPGTYQHSMNVALLSEAAAQVVGADPVLARVGASFHDVGKLKRPLHFAENQQNGKNVHDMLPPIESASIIISHLKDGTTLLNKHHLPSAVVRIAAEHHGDSLVSFFYHKSLKLDPNTQKKNFRYPGPKPSTKESAIVMLADCCEAAVRSLGEHTKEARQEMVHKVIWNKFSEADSQLSGVPLTMEQLSDIERSFNKTFEGIHHERPGYPDEGKKS